MKDLCQICGAGIPKRLDALKEVPDEALQYHQTVIALELMLAFADKADPDCVGPVLDVADRHDNENELWMLKQQVKVMLNYARRRLAKGFLASC